ncbi:MAG: PepSY domain-containing protein [Proteobacteria bacterium]|nr:PepSY domain-containing protein [Pseudomonadota bacterium]
MERSALTPWHRRVALTAGGLLLIQFLTGSLLVFREELTALSLPGGSPSVSVPFQALEESLRLQYPQLQPVSAQFPTSATRDYIFKLADGAESTVLIAVDPTDSSSRVLGWLPTFLETIRGFHEDLLLGQFGRAIIGTEAALLLFLIATGLTLWWPAKGRRKGSMRLPLRGPQRSLFFWWHRTLGSVAGGLILPSAVTGLLLAAGGFLPAHPANVTPPAQTATTNNERIQLTHELYPTLSVREVRFDARTAQIERIVLRQPGVGLQAPITDINFDPAAGQIHSIVEPGRLRGFDSVLSWCFPIHSAQWGGYGLRLLLIATGAVAVAVATLGLGLWWVRRPRSTPLAILRNRG